MSPPVTGAGLILLAGALALWPGHAYGLQSAGVATARPGGQPRHRIRLILHAVAAMAAGASVTALLGGAAGFGIGAAVAAGSWWLLRREPRRAGREDGMAERLRAAATLDLLAAGLRTGLPVPVALEAVSGRAPPGSADALRSTAGLLALGAEPAEAWAAVRTAPGLGELAAAAIRTARAGTALASAAAELAQRLRDGLGAEAEERAERAGVVLALPVGLCFLPAFFCLGVVPVVLGLAARLGGAL
ncbi:type II secretion system F family protein [Amycolatopsis sp. NPDC059027]|uniref:type II secretion system F family protein n=1 Tax=Amycolatopsis sp. NPDC059027 TaxID=3346709 RepID=UPI003671B610